MKVASSESEPLDTEREQDISQDWARVNGGLYTYLANEGEMEVAFDRAATLMRRPANYALTLESEFREAPGPAYLSVTGSTAFAGGGAVELILDASGSMWQKLDGRFRIDIAKQVLTAALREHVPAGTPTAIRVFGHRKPNVCDTNLEVPLQPLDVDAAIATLNGVSPQSLAKTPLAESLSAVAQDLGSQASAAIVVLVTDGKETCGGNPDNAIRQLQSSGIRLSLNIVGFAIDDTAVERQFADWAEAGGGRYFSASDADGLNEAVAQSLAIPFAVYDQSGALVAEGLVDGPPVEIMQGLYRVVVAASPQRTFEDVTVSGTGEIGLEL
jgi:hypothetical protein